MMRRILILLSALCFLPVSAVLAMNVEYSSPDHVQLLLSRWAGDLGSNRKVELYSGDDSQQIWTLTGTWGGQGDTAGETYADLAVGSAVHYLRADYYVYDIVEEKWTLEETQTVPLNKNSTFGFLRPSLTGLNTVTWSDTVLLSDTVVVEDGTLVIGQGVEVIFMDTTEHGAVLRISGDALLSANNVSFFNGATSYYTGQVICESDASSGLQKTLIENSSFNDVDLQIHGSNLAFTGLEFKSDDGYVEISGSKNSLIGSSMCDIYLLNASENLVQDNSLHEINVGYNAAACISNTIRANHCDLIILPGTLNTSDGNIVDSNTTGRIFIGGKNNQVIDNIVSCKEWEPAILLANEGNEVRGNQLTDCQSKGIEVSSGSNTIHQNLIKNCGDTGIFLRAFPPGATENEITENTISGCLGDGISIYGGQDTLVKGNTISHCNHPLIGGDAGISVKDFSPFAALLNLVSENDIESCEIGIRSETTAPLNDPLSANEYTGNNISLCEIGLEAVSGNALISNNAFYGNTTHALDDASHGVWNASKSALKMNIVGGPFLGGNYYEGYSVIDQDGDYIGDIPYQILGTDGVIRAMDMLPLLIPRQVTASPLTYDFGRRLLGSDTEVEISLGNSSDSLESLEISGLQITGSDAFTWDVSFENHPCLLDIDPVFDPGQTCNVLVAFSPTALGFQNASLEISSDDPDEPVFSVSFLGQGVVAPGDVNGDNALTMADAILVLKVCAGLKPPELLAEGLANGSDFVPDDMLQVNDALGILQTLALGK
ncbi:MAG: right-handed parallel beta-helix repeat-containing protein [Desulfatibacillum sp.]|nr:right-handed parallel beta-helix repeat-containing protein [Desulfatibacillum sp.]